MKSQSPRHAILVAANKPFDEVGYNHITILHLENATRRLISSATTLRIAEDAYKRRAPATTPTTPAAEPAILKLVAMAAPGEVEDAAALPPPPFVAAATLMP